MILPDTGTYTLLMEGWIGDVGSIYTYGFNVFENPVVAPIPIPGIEVRPAPDLIPQNIAVTADGPIQSGGQVTIAWQTRTDRSEEPRGGKECVSTCRSRWSP